jgi:hypothetical protein
MVGGGGARSTLVPPKKFWFELGEVKPKDIALLALIVILRFTLLLVKELG